MRWGDLASHLGRAAPGLGRVLGGPAGAVVGEVVARRLGVENTPDAVADLVRENPEALRILREIEAEVAQAYLADTQHARTAHRDHWMPWLFTLVITALWAAWRVLLMVFDVPDTNIRLFEGTTQTLDYLLIASASYWIGSSRGSADKQNILERKL